MDIRKGKSKTTVALNDSKGNGKPDKFKAGVIKTADAKLMLPPAIQGKLTALGEKYGVPFDLSNIGLDGKMAENVKTLRAIADMATAESKLLPEMIKLIRQLMRAEIKLAQFHKLVTKAALKHQQKLDKQTADIFLMMAGYGAKATKLEHRTNVRSELKKKRAEAYANHYDNSVFGEESKIIDAEFEMLESNRQILTASKTERINLNNERKQKIEQYVQSAYTN
jgi:hypothetical protein